MKKKDKKKDDTDKLEKLVNLTKMIKGDKVKIEPKGFMRGPNKWRTAEPKFPAKSSPAKPEQIVEAGGMQVDPSLAQDYENWRKDKLAEQEERRRQQQRKREAARLAAAKWR